MDMLAYFLGRLAGGGGAGGGRAPIEYTKVEVQDEIKKEEEVSPSEDAEKEEIEVFFLEAALLIEAGYVPYLDELWYVFGEKEIRKKRLKESRGYSDEKIEQIMESQLSDEEFRTYASVILDNSYDFEETFKQIKTECMRLGIWKK